MRRYYLLQQFRTATIFVFFCTIISIFHPELWILFFAHSYAFAEARAAKAVSTLALSPAMTASGFSAPKIAVPATITFEPVRFNRAI